MIVHHWSLGGSFTEARRYGPLGAKETVAAILHPGLVKSRERYDSDITLIGPIYVGITGSLERLRVNDNLGSWVIIRHSKSLSITHHSDTEFETSEKISPSLRPWSDPPGVTTRPPPDVSNRNDVLLIVMRNRNCSVDGFDALFPVRRSPALTTGSQWYLSLHTSEYAVEPSISGRVFPPGRADRSR